MDVPEIMLKFTLLVSLGSVEGGARGDQAARMSTPGAVISGCITHLKFQVKSSTVTELAVLLIIAIESVGYLENIWGDRVWSSRRK